MALTRPDISPITNSINALSNVLLVTPKAILGYNPQNTPVKDGQPLSLRDALVFHYEGEQTCTLQSDITDHTTEDNSPIEDQIALKPETITTQGFIGELNDIVPTVLQPAKNIADKLTPISAYLPGLSATAALALNEAAFLYATAQKALNTAVSAWSSLATAVSSGSADVIIGSDTRSQEIEDKQKLNVQNKQQQYFQQFYGYWRSRTLFTVQTPWAVFDNMAIMSLRAVQDEDTRVITTFEITFKKLRFASTVLTEGVQLGDQFTNPATKQQRASTQTAPLVDLGPISPTLTTTTPASQIGAILKGQ